jgi:hypothetical protein
MTSQQRGHAAELTVAADMARKGYMISFPAESTPYDILAERDGVILRVQVKTVRIRERDGVRWRVIDCTNSNGDTYENVDLYAGYDAATGQIYYINHADLDGKKELWLHPSKLYALE